MEERKIELMHIAPSQTKWLNSEYLGSTMCDDCSLTAETGISKAFRASAKQAVSCGIDVRSSDSNVCPFNSVIEHMWP